MPNFSRRGFFAAIAALPIQGLDSADLSMSLEEFKAAYLSPFMLDRQRKQDREFAEWLHGQEGNPPQLFPPADAWIRETAAQAAQDRAFFNGGRA